MKPWIHLFKTFDCYYFYDVNKNESVKIEEAVYSYLNCLLHANENITVDKSIINHINLLQSQGYLKPSELESIEHPETKNLKEYISRRLSLLTIQLTQDCNLRCLYCPYTSNDGSNRSHSNTTISLHSIEKALQILEEGSVDRECVTIGFYGGEPLLEFELLVKATQYAEKTFEGKKLKYTITTNATLLNKEMCEFLEKNKFLVMVSLDGPKKINDINRKLSNDTSSVFERVIENLKYIYKNHPSLYENLSINMVIDQSQDFHDYIYFFEQYPFLNKLGLNATLVEDDHKSNKYELSDKFLTDFNHSKLLPIFI